MPLTDPGTRSPGSMFLRYTQASILHVAAVHYIAGVDIEAVSTCRADATAFAAVVKAMLSASAAIIGWGLKDPTGLILYEELFSTPVVGTHTNPTMWFNSHTVTISGNGIPTGVGSAKGRTRVVIFDFGCIAALEGVKQNANSADAAVAGVASWLHTNLRCFADYYGQHAEPKPYHTHQFNARAQRTIGS